MQVVMTRSDGTAVSLEERCRISNRAEADLFVSLHSNAAGGTGWSGARGWEIYHHAGSKAGKTLAEAIAKSVEGNGEMMRRPAVKPETYYVLRNTEAPAVLIEHGFHTNQADVSLMRQPAYRQRLAETEVDGILAWLGVVQPVDPPEPSRETEEVELAVQWMQEQGILRGNEQGDLMLDQPVTRHQLCVMLYRALKK